MHTPQADPNSFKQEVFTHSTINSPLVEVEEWPNNNQSHSGRIVDVDTDHRFQAIAEPLNNVFLIASMFISGAASERPLEGKNQRGGNVSGSGPFRRLQLERDLYIGFGQFIHLVKAQKTPCCFLQPLADDKFKPLLRMERGKTTLSICWVAFQATPAMFILLICIVSMLQEDSRNNENSESRSVMF